MCIRDSSSTKDDKGNLYFGGQFGITKFNPAEVKIIKDVAAPLITNIELLPHGDFEGAEFSYPLNESYIFSNNECDFIVNFSDINYGNPSNKVYYYMLEGYGHEWLEVKRNGQVQFMNLDAGIYYFKVRAKLKNGEMSNNISTLKITIDPPFYSTTAFRFCCLFFLSGVAFLTYKGRVMAVQKRNIQLKEIVADQTKLLTLSLIHI